MADDSNMPIDYETDSFGNIQAIFKNGGLLKEQSVTAHLLLAILRELQAGRK
jgi:hypothetical protein